MLAKLVLNNFRRHRDLTVNFTNGIQAIRALNEQGKSTLLEAINYALFGTRALRTSIDDTVTWGEDPRTLKVELMLTVAGRAHVFTRSKSGAEVVLDGQVFVTGQNEVTNYAATLLGADASTASKLMFASQNGLRGALEEGPKALSTMIEDLGGFDTFDRILEAAQQKLALGSPSLLEERLKGAQATLEAATASLPAKPDDEAHHATLTALGNKIAELESSLPALLEKQTVAELAWQEATAQYTKRGKLEAEVEQAARRVTEAKAQVEALVEAAQKEPDTTSIETLKQSIARGEDHDKRVIAHRIFKNLPEGERWPGRLASFEAAVEESAETLKNIRASLNTVEQMIAAAKGRRISHDKCDKCGQDVTHLAHVIETNAEVDRTLATLGAQKEDLKAKLEEAEKVEARMNSIRRFAAKLQPELTKVINYVSLSELFYPAEVYWEGDAPDGDNVSVAALKAELSRVETENKAIAAAKAKHELAADQLVKATADLSMARDRLAEFKGPDHDAILELTQAKDSAMVALNGAKGEALLAKQEMDTLVKDYNQVKALWNSAQARVQDAQRVIAESQKDLDSLSFNNGLVKKLRAIRPLVADKLWNNVLASVSVMFSQMRGEESWVSKGKDGFKVNNQAIESLSGSTLDLLGLAIRCALVRTFLPQCGLLILDEPAHGCDAARTEALIGFIAGAGFSQVLLVTHEEISESVADNIITL